MSEPEREPDRECDRERESEPKPEREFEPKPEPQPKAEGEAPCEGAGDRAETPERGALPDAKGRLGTDSRMGIHALETLYLDMLALDSDGAPPRVGEVPVGSSGEQVQQHASPGYRRGRHPLEEIAHSSNRRETVREAVVEGPFDGARIDEPREEQHAGRRCRTPHGVPGSARQLQGLTDGRDTRRAR